MLIPWNVIDDKNILLSHSEYVSRVSSAKPIYDDLEKINFDISSRLLFILLVSTSVLMVLSIKFFFAIALFEIPIFYLLGKELAKVVRFQYIFLFLLSLLLILVNFYITILLLVSFFFMLYSYSRSRKKKIYVAYTQFASNLIGDIRSSEFPLEVKNAEFRLSPYRVYFKVEGNYEGFKIASEISLYAVNKWLAGIFIVIEYYSYYDRNEKFKEIIKKYLASLKQFLSMKLNQGESILG